LGHPLFIIVLAIKRLFFSFLVGLFLSYRSDAMRYFLDYFAWLYLHRGFLERAERWASDTPAGLPQSGRRPATKTGAGFAALCPL
jgi:hypothetical protein